MKSMMKDIMKKMWRFLKPKCWYIFLLGISTVYLTYYRFDIYELSPLNARNLVFLLWLLLLLLPLFSEMEFLGIKVKREVKKEVEKATEEVKDTLRKLQVQVGHPAVEKTGSILATVLVEASDSTKIGASAAA